MLVGQWVRAGGGRLGVPFSPFYAHWYPYAGRLVFVPLVVLGSAAALAPHWVDRVRRPALLAAGLYALALALGISLNVSRGGVHDLWAVFKPGPGGSLEAYQEYLPGLSALGRGIPYYVGHFPALIPSLPIHVQIWELEPGTSEGDHTHPTDDPADNYEELYLVLSGTGEITIDGSRRALTAGDAVLVPTGVGHGLYATGTEPLRILLIFGKPPAG